MKIKSNSLQPIWGTALSTTLHFIDVIQKKAVKLISDPAFSSKLLSSDPSRDYRLAIGNFSLWTVISMVFTLFFQISYDEEIFPYNLSSKRDNKPYPRTTDLYHFFRALFQNICRPFYLYMTGSTDFHRKFLCWSFYLCHSQME